MRRPAALASTLLLALAAGLAPAAGAQPDYAALGFQAYATPRPAPPVSLPDLQGKAWTLAEHRGKVVLLFFWATWWLTCREELPPLDRLYRDLKGKGLEVALISFRESPDLVERTVRQRGYTAPVLLDQSGDLAGRVYGVWGPPTVYLVDRSGRLLARAVGARDWSVPAGRKLLEDLLAAP